MKKVDMWAYGMVVFNLINPDLRHPFQKNFETTADAITPTEKTQGRPGREKKPCFSAKYKHLQAADWLLLEGVYHECAASDSQRRPSASEVVSNLETCDFQPEPLCDNTPLRVSETSSLQAFAPKVAKRISADGLNIPPFMAPANDGTNACAFLCATIANDLLMSEERQS